VCIYIYINAYVQRKVFPTMCLEYQGFDHMAYTGELLCVCVCVCFFVLFYLQGRIWCQTQCSLAEFASKGKPWLWTFTKSLLRCEMANTTVYSCSANVNIARTGVIAPKMFCTSLARASWTQICINQRHIWDSWGLCKCKWNMSSCDQLRCQYQEP